MSDFQTLFDQAKKNRLQEKGFLSQESQQPTPTPKSVQAECSSTKRVGVSLILFMFLCISIFFNFIQLSITASSFKIFSSPEHTLFIGRTEPDSAVVNKEMVERAKDIVCGKDGL